MYRLEKFDERKNRWERHGLFENYLDMIDYLEDYQSKNPKTELRFTDDGEHYYRHHWYIVKEFCDEYGWIELYRTMYKEKAHDFVDMLEAKNDDIIVKICEF